MLMASSKTPHRLFLLTLAFLSALAVVRALTVEKYAQKDEMVTRCIIEALSKALAKPNAPPLTSECRQILKSGKHEIVENKLEGGNNYYEKERYHEEYENKEEYSRMHHEEDKQSEDESEKKQHDRQSHEEERREVNSSDEDGRHLEDFYPVRNIHHDSSSQDNRSYQEYEKGRYRKYSEDLTHEQKRSQVADSTESTIYASDEKRQEIRSDEESSEEDKQFGIHGHSKERRNRYIGTGGERSNDQDKRHYEQKISGSEELEEKDGEKGDKLQNDTLHYQKRHSYGHSDEDRTIHQDQRDSDITEESIKDPEHIKNIHQNLKKSNKQMEYEEKTTLHPRNSSDKSKEEKENLDQRTNSKQDYKRPNSEEEEEKGEDEIKYYSKEKRHNSKENMITSSEHEHQREESTEVKYTSNGKDEEEERNTEPFPKVQMFLWKKWKSLDNRNPVIEGKHSEHAHFSREYEEHGDKSQEEEQGQNEGTREEHPVRHNFDHDFQVERLYDRMDKLAHYLKSKKTSMEIPVFYDSEGEKEKQNYEEKKMKHRTEEEEKELENLAAMDLELEKMAEKLLDNQRD
ncbi:secretogranin-1-like [Narcine bancroftii]|uniref:secretogranin-1-like n=1 Tax=Narcine bancroftii TaxID=1343680 RepID=UPI0038312B1A